MIEYTKTLSVKDMPDNWQNEYTLRIIKMNGDRLGISLISKEGSIIFMSVVTEPNENLTLQLTTHCFN